MSGLGTALRSTRHELEEVREAMAPLKAAAWNANEGRGRISREDLSQLEALQRRERELKAAELGVLSQLASSSTATEDVDFLDASPVAKGVAAEPGAWLSRVLDRRRADVPQLPDHMRAMAAMTTDEYGSLDEGTVLIDLISQPAVALASGIPTVKIGTTEVRVPKFTERPEAAWVGELRSFPNRTVGLRRETVRPPKVGLVSSFSIEAFEDLTPRLLAGTQRHLVRAVALAFDAGVLFGDGTDETPLGVANTPDAQVVTGDLSNLRIFAEAIGDFLAVGARPAALVMNPVDFTGLLGLPEQDGSNKPLLAGDFTQGGFRFPFYGIRTWLTPAAPVGEALLYDTSEVLIVIRREADIAVDPYYGFTEGEVGVRVYLRADVIVGNGDGVVRLQFNGS